MGTRDRDFIEVIYVLHTWLAKHNLDTSNLRINLEFSSNSAKRQAIAAVREEVKHIDMATYKVPTYWPPRHDSMTIYNTPVRFTSPEDLPGDLDEFLQRVYGREKDT